MRQLKITKSITSRDSDSLEKYLQDIGKEVLLGAEEEVELAQQIRKGDRRALEKLTKANNLTAGDSVKAKAKKMPDGRWRVVSIIKE